MSTIELNVYEILKAKFGEAEAKQVIEFIDTKAEKKVDIKTEVLEKGFSKDIKIVKQELRKEISYTKSEIIKWMFIFWITQMISLFAFMLYFVKK